MITCSHTCGHLWQRSTSSPAGSKLREVWEAGYFKDIDPEYHRPFDRYVDELLAALVRRAGAGAV